MKRSWQVRAWYAADAVVRRVRPVRLRVAARSIHAGVCLGLASRELLVAVDEEAYASRRYAYHDTDEHNLRGLFDWELDALRSAFPQQGRILVTSAGGGREAIALWQRGYEVVACECNERLLSFFARRGDPLRFRVVRTLGNALARMSGSEKVELGDVIDPTWQHYVSRGELEQEAAHAGLVLERWSQDGYAHAIVRRRSRG